MIFSSSSILGLAVSERSIACVQLAAGAGSTKRVVRRLATFALPAELSLEQPGPLGQALASFLRSNGFSATRAVVGVPAKWLIAHEKDVPPADPDALRALLRIQAERDSAVESGELVFDYADDAGADPRQGGKVLMVGILRRQLERVEQTMDAAGLTVIAVMPTALALATALSAAGGGGSDDAADGEASMLVLSRGGGEIVWRRAGAARMLRHVPISATNGHGGVAMAALGSELRRAAVMTHPVGSNGAKPPAPGAAGRHRELLLWDLMGLSQADVDDLSGRLGTPVRRVVANRDLGVQIVSAPEALAAGAEPHTKTLDDATSADAAAAYAPAMALALAGARRNVTLDLAHSRLSPPPQRRMRRTTAWGIAVGALAVIAIVALFISIRQRQSELAEMKSQLSKMSDDIKQAQKNVDRFNYGRGYFEARPPMLECLRDLTQAFQDSEPIYVTTFTLRDNRAGQISGKSNDQRYVLYVLDRLKRNPKFSDAKLLEMRDAGGRTREVAFSMSFNYGGE